ncbi:4'-phosphopantetheinyl transferase NpgA [Rasamsonia emersonii CBS 393.64]|uniref:holo-[acyl-carrier-protein] synthase n=1 Tax=Rasamsonia emersonii (strain ATCC 16479 / CBS 393.64 / IMI 116815) TaxID=1408163 RepID=A0A0F4YK92_RASE3|nr:4'-phosphopantetheinyl transferase NpgA [Rasamsonia emersonii CBS 393.64]KKA18028.1 4'-phosphopantetheinyl transferase NpgA [Rasamsonia emersonii CBS 393.64]
MAPREKSLTRWYIDTRHLTATTSSLPLLETLQPDDQQTVQKFIRLEDRHMSLASYLLKYLFIHRTCRIPWSEITISRTPKPHQRPCFIPSCRTRADGSEVPDVEFNHYPKPSSPTPSHQPPLSRPSPNVGIDITCVNEPSRRRRDSITTEKALAEFVDIFAEIFSPRELSTIKQIPLDSRSSPEKLQEAIKSRVRLFYAYWALKEAYIKMTGEALLAPWLRELEFTNVVAPEPVSSTSSSSPWSKPYKGVQTWLYGKRVDDVRIELAAFETDYLVATAARGGRFGARGHHHASNNNNTVPDDGNDDSDPWKDLEQIDIERDITACAKGHCHCLD